MKNKVNLINHLLGGITLKVLLVNGSPNQYGCTNRALEEIANTLKEESIDSEIFWIGKKPISGCISCYKCEEIGTCIFKDALADFIPKAHEADGFIFGSPVHYASAGGAISALLDRAFFSEMLGSDDNAFYLKPAAAIVSARRAGTTAALDQLNKYFTIQEMPVISSCYWNMVHGNTPEEVEQDKEGLMVMRTLARNMAWFLRLKETGIKAGIPFPQKEEAVATNFIR